MSQKQYRCPLDRDLVAQMPVVERKNRSMHYLEKAGLEIVSMVVLQADLCQVECYPKIYQKATALEHYLIHRCNSALL